MKTGWGLDYVREMDVLTFNTLCAILTKLVYREKCEAAWVNMTAAQGTKESMQTLTSQWKTTIGDDPVKPVDKTPAVGQGAKAFLKAIGIGSKGGSF